jgi:hypothetical protein
MKGSRTLLMALMSGSLLACRPATEEDRKALVGLWIPDDGSRHTIEFKEDGVFDFVYDVVPPRTVLRIKWSLSTKGEVDIRQDDGSHYKTCRYSIDADKLTIDDGSGSECLRSAATPTTLMPRTFTKSPALP